MKFRGSAPQNGFRNITKEEQQKVNEQLTQMAMSRALREVNDSLNFAWSTCLLASLAVLSPDVLNIFRTQFFASIEKLKKSNPLGVNNEEEIKKVLDVDKLIDSCSEPYISTLESVEKAIKNVQPK